METMKKPARIYVCIPILLFGLLQDAWAGDLMNVDFLERQAQKNDAPLQSMTQAFNQQLYADKFAVVPFLLDMSVNTVITSIFYIHTSFVPKNILGNVGGILFTTSILYKSIQDQQRRKHLKQMFLNINQRVEWLNQQVEQLYPQVKAGNPAAYEALSNLTGEAAIKEVREEENLSVSQSAAKDGVMVLDTPISGGSGGYCPTAQ
jgi:hypothetical protein